MAETLRILRGIRTQVPKINSLELTDSRKYASRPICGVGVVAWCDDQVLLIRRGKEPGRGEWSIPGGAVELGERVRDAALREFAEECGGEIQLRELVDVVDIFSRDEQGELEYHYIVVDFCAEWSGGELGAKSDVMDARWVRPQDLDLYGLPAWTRAVIDKAMALRAGVTRHSSNHGGN